jgi:hypothetical protein
LLWWQFCTLVVFCVSWTLVESCVSASAATACSSQLDKCNCVNRH